MMTIERRPTIFPGKYRQTPDAVRAPRWFALLLVPALLLILSAPAMADGDTEQLVAAAIQDFLYEQARDAGDEVSIEVSPSAARFPACPDPRPFLPGNLGQRAWGRVSVGVRCGEDGKQVRYMTAEVKVLGDYLEIAAPVQAGTVITGDMLVVRQGDLSRLPPQALREQADVVGQMARRRLMPGTVVQSNHVASVPVVERGQKVKVETRGQGFVISREGEAMESGGLGESIRVRLSPREIMSAEVTGNGRVGIAH